MFWLSSEVVEGAGRQVYGVRVRDPDSISEKEQPGDRKVMSKNKRAPDIHPSFPTPQRDLSRFTDEGRGGVTRGG